MLIVSDLISTDFLWVSQFLKKKKKKTSFNEWWFQLCEPI